MRSRLEIGLALSFALAACKKPAPAPADAGAPAAQHTGDDFTMRDLAAAAEVDAKLARLSWLATEYKMAMTFQQTPELRKETDRLQPLLEDGAAQLAQAFAAVRDPRDVALARPAVEAARKWPAALLATREELLGPPNVDAASAAAALDAVDDAVARALVAYRRFRAGWNLVDAPQEPPPVIAFLQERRKLEQLENAAGALLPGAKGPGSAGGEPAEVRKQVDAAIDAADKAAAGITDERREAAQRWVAAEGGALRSLLGLVPGGPDGGPGPEESGKLSLLYQHRKADALAATADYTRLTAGRVK